MNLALLILCLTALNTFAQMFTPYQYAKAAWMTTRFYGGQRAGDAPNWILLNHPIEAFHTSFERDSINNLDVNGGWFDCGDFMMFGQTQYYTAYILAKAYEEFPQGFRDHYNGETYADYQAAGAYNFENGKPNGVPDLLDELRFEGNFLIKIAPTAQLFVYQKGNSNLDHKNWETAHRTKILQQIYGGENDLPRPIYANPEDASMPSFAAAAMAVMSKIFRPRDPAFADQLLAHAVNAYIYATNHPGTATSANPTCDAGNSNLCYPANTKWQDDLTTAATELYDVTKDPIYKAKSDSLAAAGAIYGSAFGSDWANNDAQALYARATIMGDALALSSFNSLVTSYMASLNSEGITMIGNTDWGSMRYVASTAFLLALYDKVNQTTFYRKSLYTQIDFLLGGNASRQSFVSGYCENCLNSPQHPHHRNIYLNDNNLPDKGKQSLVIPTILKQFGALVGGNSGRVSYAYTDSILQYSTAEVCIDYNAGLVGALGAIVSEQAPASLPLPLTVLPVSMQQQHGFSVETSGRRIHFASSTQHAFSANIYDMRGASIASLQSSTGQDVDWDAARAGVFFVAVHSANNDQVGQFRVALVN